MCSPKMHFQEILFRWVFSVDVEEPLEAVSITVRNLFFGYRLQYDRYLIFNYHHQVKSKSRDPSTDPVTTDCRISTGGQVGIIA